MKQKHLKQGFTLIEVLIVVLIVAILSAIAVPQYQKAVLKSRFSSLMPTTKSIADGNEMYYMTNGHYADDIAKLDVKAANTEDMELEVSDEAETPELSYVIASRPNIKNNLIMYQKHSPKFADTVHCEAFKDDARAQWLCKDALHGEYFTGGSLNADYDTYILSGTIKEGDAFAKQCSPGGETYTCECGPSLQGTCDTTTGQWQYSGSCLAQPEGGTYTCPTDGSSFTVASRCNQAGTAWERYYVSGSCGAASQGCDEWSNTNCDGVIFDVGKSCQSYSSSPISCKNAYFPARSGDMIYAVCSSLAGSVDCSGSIFERHTSCGNAICKNAIFSGEKSQCMGWGNNNGDCTGSTFSGKDSYCAGSNCSGSIFTGQGSYCAASSSTDCSGSTFRTGSTCKSSATNGCDTAIYQGGCCSGDYCGNAPVCE